MSAPVLPNAPVTAPVSILVWRYGFQADVFNISKPKRFAKAIKSGQSVYAIMAQSISHSADRSTINVETVANETSTISIKFAEFKYVFSKKIADELITHKNYNHIIEIKNNKLFYNFLYNFLKHRICYFKKIFKRCFNKKLNQTFY